MQAAFPGVVIIRPAVMFAPTTAFSRRFSGCFDGCRSILCLATAERDSSQCMRTAAAIVQVLRSSEALHPIYELAGPRVYSYKELLQTIAREAGLRPVFMQVPFGAWYSLASLAEILPSPLLTRSQVELMQVETTASNLPGFRELGISPRPLEQELQAMLTRSA